jgi:glucose-1-phosphate thymidylyltransferase
MPIYDKPMIYFPLTTLMLAGIRRVLIITTPHEQTMFKALLGDGKQWGMELIYAVQPSPDGLAQAFIIGREFINNRPCALVLGDNIFYGHGLSATLQRAAGRASGATVFGYWVKNPGDYGVAEMSGEDRVIGLEEKPKVPKSNYAVTGLYFYDEKVVELAASLKPSPRGELEITDLNRRYLEAGALRLEKLGRGYAWLDTGNPDALLQAANFIQTIQQRQGLQVSCPEEVAFRQGWIGPTEVAQIAAQLSKTAYGQYLSSLLTEPREG